MKKYILLVAVFCTLKIVYAEKAPESFFTPKKSYAVEVSLPNTTLKRMPMYRNAVTSLAIKEDYIIGGTTARKGLSPFIFSVSISKKEMVEYYDVAKVIQGQFAVSTDFYKAQNGRLFAGTLPDMKKDGTAGDGHILEISVNQDGSLEITDKGVPVPGEGVFSILAGTDDKIIYGISHPTGLFFEYDTESGKSITYKDILPANNELQDLNLMVLEPSAYLGKKLIKDGQGRIWGSAPINKIFSFDPRTKAFSIYRNAIPLVWGRQTLGQVESWVKAPDGKLFGGNAGDGQLFSLDPATGKVKNFGKPVMANGLKALAYGRDGKLYGVAGGKPAETYMFTWTETNGFTVLGNPQFIMTAPGIEQGIEWRAFQIGSLAVSDDGKYMVIGENEDLSQILVFEIEEK